MTGKDRKTILINTVR